MADRLDYDLFWVQSFKSWRKGFINYLVLTFFYLAAIFITLTSKMTKIYIKLQTALFGFTMYTFYI